jgi:hypothetical protein
MQFSIFSQSLSGWMSPVDWIVAAGAGAILASKAAAAWEDNVEICSCASNAQ